MPASTVSRTEKSIQKAVIDWARKEGCICIKLSTNGRFGTAGWPDYLILYNRMAMFMEFKRAGQVMTPLQRRRADELEAQHFDVYTIDNVNEGKVVIAAWMRQS